MARLVLPSSAGRFLPGSRADSLPFPTSIVSDTLNPAYTRTPLFEKLVTPSMEAKAPFSKKETEVWQSFDDKIVRTKSGTR